MAHRFPKILLVADSITLLTTPQGEDSASVYTPYAVKTLAGYAPNGFHNGIGSAAQFNGPAGLALDANENPIVADSGNTRFAG